MTQYALEAWHTLKPPKSLRDQPHGPLPPLLILLTVVTGLVDAFSYLDLGRVFVANMTGNVVFLAFDLGGAKGFVWWASLLATVTFLVGAFVGGRVAATFRMHRGRHLMIAAGLQFVLVIVAFAVGIAFGQPYDNRALAVLIVFLGVAMGLQNATARSLAVPDLTTTVLTMTLTGISADTAAAGANSSKLGRRLLSIASMFVGALIGTLLVVPGHGAYSLLLAAVLLVLVAAVSRRHASSTEAWAQPR